MLEFRRMEEQDLDQVMQIERESFSLPWTRQDFMDSLHKPEAIYVVADLDGTIVGYCGLWGIVGEGQINNVAVSSNHRGKKIGTHLLQKMIALGDEEGMTAYTLEVRVSNAPAIALYKKIGFHEVGVRKNYYSEPREDALIMWKYNKGTEA